MKPRKSLRVKILLLFSIAVLVPAAIISITTITLGYKSLWNSVKREQKEIARRVGDTIRFRIDSIEHLIQSLSKRDYSNVNIPNIKNSFRDIIKLDESILEIILTERRTARDITGVIKNHGKWGDSTLSNRRNRDEFTGAQKDGTYVSKVTFSGTRIPYIIISASGKKHLVVAKVDLRGIWDTISKIQVGENGYAFIVDAGGMLIAHPATERVIAHADFTNLGVVKDFLDGKKDISGIYRDDAGEKVISFCYTIKKLGWGVFTNLPYKEVISPVNKMVFRVISLSGAFSAVFLFVGLKFASSFMNPLMQLKKAAERLSEGKFDVELNVKSDDELEELAGTFSKMIKSLRELEELRDDLISMIVHDMKSPLSGIVGSLDYLIATKKDIEEQKEIIEITKKSAENLHTLIQNLLDISKMEDNKLPLRQEKVKLFDLLYDTGKQFGLAAKTESKEFTFSIQDEIPVVKIDAMLIKRVVTNLLTNSLHHTTSGGKIWLSVANNEESRTVRVEIGDDGVGIPEEYRTRIFEKFVQVERRRARLRTGTGLGLTFCKMAVELHGGKIWVESEEGRGSKFFFEIPLN